MNKYVFVLAEVRDGEFRPITFELLTEAKRLAENLQGKVVCILLGYSVSHLCPILGEYGADTVIVVEKQYLSDYSTWLYVAVLQELAGLYQPLVFLIGSTPIGKEIAPALAARLGVGLVTECNKLGIDKNSKLVMSKFIYGGQASANVICHNGKPQIVTFEPGLIDVEKPDKSKNIEIVSMDIELKEGLFPATKVIGFEEGDPKLIDITDAAIIVAGGAGMGDNAHFKLVEDLAEVLNGSLGGSRVAVDKGWLPNIRQVGLSGKTTAPEIFIACGISGAIHFQAGMKESRRIVAINTDRNAPIFKIADVKILGDVRHVLPLVIEFIKQAKESSSKGTT